MDLRLSERLLFIQVCNPTGVVLEEARRLSFPKEALLKQKGSSCAFFKKALVETPIGFPRKDEEALRTPELDVEGP